MLLADDLPLSRIRHAWFTWLLLLSCVAGFLLQAASPWPEENLALVPKDLLAAPTTPEVMLRAIGYMFLHGDVVHLAGNMLVLFIFGDNVEDALGHLRFLLLYLLSGIAGAGLHSAVTGDPELPLVGASAAIAGVMAAYLLLYPRAKLFVLAFARIPVLVPASWFVGAWFLMNIYSGFYAADREVAWWAHVGGFASGALLVFVLRPAGVALFQPALAQPTARLGWLRRMSFDFSPQLGPRPAGQEETWHDGPAAAIGKALVFVVLLLLSAWF